MFGLVALAASLFHLGRPQFAFRAVLGLNPRGRYAERWRHLRGCGRFFNVIRDTTTDRIAAAYRLGESPP